MVLAWYNCSTIKGTGVLAYTHDEANLRKHGISVDDCIFVIETTEFWFEETPSRDGNTRIVFVGSTGPNKKPIEVGVEFFEEDEEAGLEQVSHIYHAMKATKESMRKAHDE